MSLKCGGERGPPTPIPLSRIRDIYSSLSIFSNPSKFPWRHGVIAIWGIHRIFEPRAVEQRVGKLCSRERWCVPHDRHVFPISKFNFYRPSCTFQLGYLLNLYWDLREKKFSKLKILISFILWKLYLKYNKERSDNENVKCVIRKCLVIRRTKRTV